MKKQSQTLIERFGFDDKELTTPKHDKMLLYLLEGNNYKQIVDISLAYLANKEPKLTILSYTLKAKVAESPVLGYNNFNIGFVDLEIKLITRERFTREDNSYYEYNFIRNIRVEIKPTVKSIGELIKQIRLYESHQDSNTGYFYCVMTTTPNLKSILEPQNISVFEYTIEEPISSLANGELKREG